MNGEHGTASRPIPERVERVERELERVHASIHGLEKGQKDMQGQLTTIVNAVTTTDGRAVERAAAVKVELREDAERKARERGELLKNGLAMITAIVLIVGAIGGPYVSKLNSTAVGQEQNTKDLSAVRELIAADHAEIMRNRDTLEIAREKNRWQDEHLFDQATRQAHDEGAAGWPLPSR